MPFMERIKKVFGGGEEEAVGKRRITPYGTSFLKMPQNELEELDEDYRLRFKRGKKLSEEAADKVKGPYRKSVLEPIIEVINNAELEHLKYLFTNDGKAREKLGLKLMNEGKATETQLSKLEGARIFFDKALPTRKANLFWERLDEALENPVSRRGALNAMSKGFNNIFQGKLMVRTGFYYDKGGVLVPGFHIVSAAEHGIDLEKAAYRVPVNDEKGNISYDAEKLEKHLAGFKQSLENANLKLEKLNAELDEKDYLGKEFRQGIEAQISDLKLKTENAGEVIQEQEKLVELLKKNKDYRFTPSLKILAPRERMPPAVIDLEKSDASIGTDQDPIAIGVPAVSLKNKETDLAHFYDSFLSKDHPGFHWTEPVRKGLGQSAGGMDMDHASKQKFFRFSKKLKAYVGSYLVPSTGYYTTGKEGGYLHQKIGYYGQGVAIGVFAAHRLHELLLEKIGK